MISISLGKRSQNMKYLFLGSHPDDIEIGCGGTVLRLTHDHPGATYYWLVFSSPGLRRAEAQKAATLFLHKVVRKFVVIKDFPESYFPYSGAAIKQTFDSLKQTFSPDVVFTHYRHDLHQDHRLISDLTWNTFRNQCIFEYEIPKYDGDLGAPNAYSPLTTAQLNNKISYIMRCFRSQCQKYWFTEDTFRAMPRIRGIESAASTGFAEAFYARKLIF